MTTTQKIIGFVDILGFKDMVHKYDSGAEPDLLDNLIEIINSAGIFLKLKHSTPSSDKLNNWKEKFEVKVFSDCFCLSIPLEFENFTFEENVTLFYQYLSGFQILLLEKGYLIRGGLTIGSYYSDDNLIFSGGLVEAYELESEYAKMPRIIVSDKFLSKLKEKNFSNSNYMLLCDKCSIFINPFNHKLINSDFCDKMVSEFVDTIGILGSLDKSFREMDEEDKQKTIKEILTIVNEKIEKFKFDVKVTKKYVWLKEFLKHEIGEKSEIQFENYKY